MPPLKTKSKYRNKHCVVAGKKFPSIKEGTRYLELLSLQRKGKIFKLQTQVPFSIIINGITVCKYKADFVYYNAAGARVVEDCKGFRTDVYKLKKKLMYAAHGIDILET